MLLFLFGSLLLVVAVAVIVLSAKATFGWARWRLSGEYGKPYTFPDAIMGSLSDLVGEGAKHRWFEYVLALFIFSTVNSISIAFTSPGEALLPEAFKEATAPIAQSEIGQTVARGFATIFHGGAPSPAATAPAPAPAISTIAQSETVGFWPSLSWGWLAVLYGAITFLVALIAFGEGIFKAIKKAIEKHRGEHEEAHKEKVIAWQAEVKRIQDEGAQRNKGKKGQQQSSLTLPPQPEHQPWWKNKAILWAFGADVVAGIFEHYFETRTGLRKGAA